MFFDPLYQKLLEIEKEIVCEVVRGDNTTWENLQIATHKLVSFTPHIVLICALQFADFLKLCLSPRTTSLTISFSISNSFWY